MNLKVMLVAVAAAGALAAGCGSSDGGDSTQAPSSGTTAASEAGSVTIASVRETGSMIPWVAERQGFFEEQDLDVRVTTDLATPSIVPSLANGRIQGVVGTWSTVPLFLAGGLDLVGIQGMTVGDERDPWGIYVKDDSSYEGMADLKGKTIAVNSLGSISEASARRAAVEAGLDRDDVRLVPIPFTEMAAALRAGRVDGAQLQEPFVTLTRADTPIRSLAGVYPSIREDGPVPNIVLLVTREFYDANPRTVAGLRAALAEGVRFALDNPGRIRADLPAYAGIDPGVAEDPDLVLPAWSSDPVDAREVQYLADLMAEYGVIRRSVDVADNVKSE